jgi:hypothetical protein
MGERQIMRLKKGNLLPKKGKVLHPAEPDGDLGVGYAAAIATALRQELGPTHQAIKTAMRWTGASERTVKYWFAGTGGPSGEHLIALARHSNAVLDVFLLLAGRPRHSVALRVMEASGKLKDIITTIQEAIEETS